MKSKLSTVPISYKKMNVIASIIRGQQAVSALNQLKLMPKKGAQILYKLLASAVANAEHNESQKAENLIIKQVIVNKGSVMKRWRPISRGQAHPYRKQNTNILIELSVSAPEKPTAKKAISEKKATAPKKQATSKNTTKSTPKPKTK